MLVTEVTEGSVQNLMLCLTVRGASPHRELADAVHQGERNFATQRSRGRSASLRETFCHTRGTVVLGMSIQASSHRLFPLVRAVC